MIKTIKKLSNIRKDSFIIQIVLNVSLLSLISLAILVLISAKNRYDSFELDKQQIRHNILSSKMDIIQNQTLTARRYIQYAKEKYHEDIIDQLKENVETDFRFIRYLHLSNLSKSKGEILKMIQRAYKQDQEEKRNFFVNTLNGKSIINISSPSSEGKELLDLTDYRGNKVVQNEISALENNQDALLTYQLEAGDNSLFSRKITYIKKYKPLNIYLGEALYLEDHIEKVKSKIIELLADIRFGKEGYVFLNTKDGYGLIKDGEIVDNPVNMWNLTDPNGVKVMQEEYRASNTPGGDFIYYSWRKLNSDEIEKKVAFVAGVDEFNWMLGAGSYLDEINDKINEREEVLRADLYEDIFLFAAILLIVLLSGFFMLRYFIRTEQAQVNMFIDYFKETGDSFEMLDIRKFRYSEFMRMAESLNRMVKERKKIADERETDRLLLRYMIDAIPDAIAYKDMRMRYLGCNKAFENIFGIPRDSLVNKSSREVFPEKVVEELRQVENKLFETKEPVRKEIWMNNARGEYVLFDLVKSFYYDKSGNILGMISVARDMTDNEKQKKHLQDALEKASQSDQLKSAFLTNISHEIRTPVNAIRGFSSVIRDDDMSTEEVLDLISQVSAASEQLLKVLENVLFLSLIESESLVYYPSEVDVKEILKTVFDDVVNRHTQKKDSIQFSYSLKLPKENLMKNIDPFWFKVVADNVIDNAFKFTDKGSVKVEAKSGNGYLRLVVHDTGCGIPEGSEKSIYNSFYRLPNNQKTIDRGTGSGLFIVKRLMNKMQGTVWYESELAEGTSFFLDFPETIPSGLETQTKDRGMDGLLFSGYHFLLSFSDDIKFEFLRIILNRKSAEVVRASSVEETISQCADHKIDIVIVDSLMGRKHTLELIRKVKTATKKPVVVLLSPQDGLSDAEVLKAGALGVLHRPLDIKHFYETTYRILSNSRTRD